MTISVEVLMQRLNDRTTERDYHKRMSDKLAENINMLRDALEAIRATDDLRKAHLEATAALSRS